MHTWYRRVTVTLLTITALLLSTLGVGLATTPTDDPVEAAAGWLATQLVDDERIEVVFGDDTFDDAGLTADVVYALAAAGVASGSIASAADWLETQVGAYTGTDFGSTFAGATAKLILVAATTDRDPTSFGGVDLVAQLEALEADSGRFSDDATDFETGDPADFSNTITQSLALIALQRASGGPSDTAVGFLIDQACGDGGFPIVLEGDDCTSGVDATAFAVLALAAVGGDDATAAVDAAVAWLLDVQQADGSFVGDEGANSNTTGLAAAALATVGEDAAAAAARDWVLTLQHGCDDAEPGAIAFDPDDSGDRVRATPQALLGLTGTSVAVVSSAGASAAVPVLDCPDTAATDELETLPETGTTVALVSLLAALLVAAGLLSLSAASRRLARR